MSISVNEINVIRKSLENMSKDVVFCKSNEFDTFWIVDDCHMIVKFDKKEHNVRVVSNNTVELNKKIANFVEYDLGKHYELSKFDYNEFVDICQSRDYRAISMQRVSKHDDDRNIFSTIIYNNLLDEYVAFLYNSTDKAFYCGYYTITFEYAVEKYNSRIAR